MNKRSKFLITGVGSITAVGMIPIAVVACGNDNNTPQGFINKFNQVKSLGASTVNDRNVLFGKTNSFRCLTIL